MENPVSPPSLGQASSSNLIPQAPAGAHGSSLKSRPSESDGEQDELMRAIALSLQISETESSLVSNHGTTSNPSSIDAVIDYLLENPVSSLSLGQASCSNVRPKAHSGAHGSSLKSRPSESDGEQDELMRAIALSLGENISEASSPSVSTRGSNSGTTNKPKPR